VQTFADRGCRVVSATDPPGRYFGFLDQRGPSLFLLLFTKYYQGDQTKEDKMCGHVTSMGKGKKKVKLSLSLTN
jgi:hypothetical protein